MKWFGRKANMDAGNAAVAGAPRVRGSVKFWQHTWGRITVPHVEAEGESIFVHFSGIRDDAAKDSGGYRKLHENDLVEFSIELTDRGPKAIDVVVISRKEVLA